MKQLEVMWGLNSHECVYTRTLFTVWTHCSQEVILHVFGGHGACNCLLEVCSTDFLGDLLGKLLCKKTPWRWTCTHCHILKDKRQGPAVQHRGLCPMWCGSLDGRGVWGRVDTCICMADAVHQRLSQHRSLAIPQYKIKFSVFFFFLKTGRVPWKEA